MEKLVNPSARFWAGKRVLLTGHTGFKGSWLALWLHRLGAHVTGLALAPHTQPNLFTEAGIAACLDHHVGDIRHPEQVNRIVSDAQPDIVFHLAAQALVRQGYRDPTGTWACNVQGTVHVLEALRQHSQAQVIVAITTDKVYQNRETRHAYAETDPLGGHDPYSASKAACELVIDSYRSSFFIANNVRISSGRAGNVIGGGDWSAERLIPDAMRAWAANDTLSLRYPHAVRPWQHVLEPLAAYLRLAEQTWHHAELAGAYNFGPDHQETASVGEVVRLAQAAWPLSQVDWPDDLSRTEGMHEAGLLMLDTTKAKQQLGVRSRWDLPTTVARTTGWYQAYSQGAAAHDLCMADLDAYLDSPYLP